MINMEWQINMDLTVFDSEQVRRLEDHKISLKGIVT